VLLRILVALVLLLLPVVSCAVNDVIGKAAMLVIIIKVDVSMTARIELVNMSRLPDR